MTDNSTNTTSFEGSHAEIAGLLVGRLHRDLRRIARGHLAREGAHDSDPTALVNEMYLRLARGMRFAAGSDAQFLALASVCMGHVLVDDARRRHASKRPHGGRVDLDDVELPVAAAIERVLPVREALRRLAARNQRLATIVTLRYCEEFSLEEVALAVGISLATVKREVRAGLAALRALLEN
jgi:RNA polymerase sigma factor (TIGR02999 family)